MNITVNIELQPFQAPNYVLAVSTTRKRQEGIVETQKYALEELDAETLGKLCDGFRAEVFSKAGKVDPTTAA